MKKLLAIACLMAAAVPAHAEVVSSAPNGFHIRRTVTVPVGPDSAFTAFANVGRWWNPQHSYGGVASRLTMELRPGGCFCERLIGGGIEHLRVTYVDRPQRLLLTGALGPLLFQAVSGVMDLKFEAAGTGTKVTMDYKVAGFANGGADKLSTPVDKVLGEQMSRYAASVTAK